MPEETDEEIYKRLSALLGTDYLPEDIAARLRSSPVPSMTAEEMEMEPPLEGGWFDLIPYMNDEQAKAQGYSPLQAHALNRGAFAANMLMPGGEVATVKNLKNLKKVLKAKDATKAATRWAIRALEETPKAARSAMSGFGSEGQSIFEQMWKQHLKETSMLPWQQQLKSMEVPDVWLTKKPVAMYKDPDVVTKAHKSSRTSPAEIKGHKLPWLEKHHTPQPKPGGPGYYLDVGDEADALRQIREALAKEGLPRDLVVEPTKGVYKDTGQKMYSMPRVKSDMTGPWPGEHRKLAHADFSIMSKQDRISLVNQLENAIDSMHRRGVGHGDLHAGNILVSYKKNKPTLEIIDPWPSRDSAFSIGKDHRYLTDHKMRILYPEIRAREGLFLNKQSERQATMYMKKYGVDPQEVEDFKRLHKQKMHNQDKDIEELGKQRIKDLAEGNVPPLKD